MLKRIGTGRSEGPEEQQQQQQKEEEEEEALAAGQSLSERSYESVQHTTTVVGSILRCEFLFCCIRCICLLFLFVVFVCCFFVLDVAAAAAAAVND